MFFAVSISTLRSTIKIKLLPGNFFPVINLKAQKNVGVIGLSIVVFTRVSAAKQIGAYKVSNYLNDQKLHYDEEI